MLTLLALLTVAATLVSPFLAVQASVALDRKKDQRDRKFDIFRTLMLTRGTLFAFEHVRALNAIGIEFHGDKKAAAVLAAWRAYFAHLGLPLCKTEEEAKQWSVQRFDLLVALLREMSLYFKREFDSDFIRNTCYVPNAHGEIEAQTAEMRRLLLDLLKGERAIPIVPISLPQPAAPPTLQTNGGGKPLIESEQTEPAQLPTADLKKQLEV